MEQIPESILASACTYVYVAVKGSLHAADSSVFGLSDAELNALVKRFHGYRKDIINGHLLKATPIEIVNALAELGYKVVGTTGEAEIVWTMQREA